MSQSFDYFALGQLDAMLELKEILDDFTLSQQAELDILQTWYDAWIDYAQACDELRRFYEKKGVNLPQK